MCKQLGNLSMNPKPVTWQCVGWKAASSVMTSVILNVSRCLGLVFGTSVTLQWLPSTEKKAHAVSCLHQHRLPMYDIWRSEEKCKLGGLGGVSAEQSSWMRIWCRQSGMFNIVVHTSGICISAVQIFCTQYHLCSSVLKWMSCAKLHVYVLIPNDDAV